MKVMVILSATLLLTAWSAKRIGKSHPWPSADHFHGNSSARILGGRRGVVTMLVRKQQLGGEQP